MTAAVGLYAVWAGLGLDGIGCCVLVAVVEDLLSVVVVDVCCCCVEYDVDVCVMMSMIFREMFAECCSSVV